LDSPTSRGIQKFLLALYSFIQERRRGPGCNVDTKLIIESRAFPCDNQRCNILEVAVALRLLVAVLALHSFAWAGSFDQPVFKRTVDLGPSKSSPGARGKVTCYFFSSFMIKEVDMAEKGAARLAIVPTEAVPTPAVPAPTAPK
jgi:hypothetical protein